MHTHSRGCSFGFLRLHPFSLSLSVSLCLLERVYKIFFLHVHKHLHVSVALLQVPLALAWAITIHKSQGMSIDSLTVCLTDVWEAGQVCTIAHIAHE